MSSKRLNTLVTRIRENMSRATAEQKARFATLLEQIMAQEAQTPNQPMTAEGLAQELKYLERLLPNVKQISKGQLADLHEFEMSLRKLVLAGMDQFQGRTTDVVSAIDEAIDAVDLLQSRIYQVETALVDAIQKTGWDLKDLEDEANFQEDINRPMTELDLGPRDTRCYLQGYKCYQQDQPMVNPYEPGTGQYRDWRDGYHQAVRDHGTAK